MVFKLVFIIEVRTKGTEHRQRVERSDRISILSASKARPLLLHPEPGTEALKHCGDYFCLFLVCKLSRRPALSTYQRLTHKPRASYGYALGLSDWRLVSDSLRRMGDRTLWAEVIRYRAHVSEIDRIRVQREELQRQCFLAGLEMGLSQQRLQDARAVQRILEDMVQDQHINQQQPVRQCGRRGRGHPA